MSMLKSLIAPTLPEDETGESTRIVRKGMLFGVVLVSGFFLWASVAPISGAVIATGKIKITTNRKTIQHLEGGLIKEILVRDGDMVKQGQSLLLLEDTRNSAELNILRDQHAALMAKEARLLAEKTLSRKINFPAELGKPVTEKHQELIAKETSLFNSKRKMLDDQISLLQTELGHSKDEVVSYQQQLSAIEQNIKYKQEQVAMREGLLAKNFVGKADVLNYQQSVTEKKEQLGEQSAALNNTRSRVAGIQLQIIDVKNRYIQDADNELKDTSRELFELVERIRPAEDTLNRSTVIAPIAGQVIGLKVTTVGGVVRPGEPIMDIVPASDDLVIEVNVKNSDIDTVYMGQLAEVQLDAYNQRTTPMVKGSVVYVAGDAIEDQRTGTYTYPAHVRVIKDSLKYLQHVKIEPGMPATAFIKTQDRTAMEYLISPITGRLRQTFREE